MGIETKSAIEKDYEDLYDAARQGASSAYLAKRHIVLATTLFRILADERQQPAVEKPAEDVPQWCLCLAERLRGSLGATRGVLAKMIHEAAEREVVRRVAEAVAEKDKRIAELDKLLGDSNAAFKSADALSVTEKKLRVEYQSIVYEACRLLDEKTNPPDCSIDKVSERIMNLRRKLGDSWKETEALKQQLAERDAEVEAKQRIATDLRTTIHAKNKQIRALEVNLRDRNKQLAAAQAELEEVKVDRDNGYTAARVNKAEVEKLQAELAECRKPVEDVDFQEVLGRLPHEVGNAHQRIHITQDIITKRVEPFLQRELNARLAAEDRERELRELAKTKYLETRTGIGIFQPRAAGVATDAQFDEALATYRATRKEDRPA